MNRNGKNKMKAAIGSAAKVALVMAVLFGPIVAAQNVNATTEQTVGELQKMSSGAGLVLLFGLQRG